jgi:hypothetical protein
MWVDTAADPSILKIRNADNDAWITIGQIDQTGDKFNLTCANATISENLTLNAQGDLRFADSDSSNWVAFQAPATVASNVTWTLPSADGTSGQVLRTDGSGVLSWGNTIPNIIYLTTGTGATYTTPTGVRALYVECVGGGGGGGGVDGAGAGTGAGAGGGGGGGYCAKLITSPSATYTYTIGAGGTGGASGANDGTAGGDTTFTDGTITLTADGGALGSGNTAASTNSYYPPSGANFPSGGDINIGGGLGGPRSRGNFASYAGGNGGSSYFGAGSRTTSVANSALAGGNASEYGGGGSGAAVEDVTTNDAGGDGYQGLIRITEYY